MTLKKLLILLLVFSLALPLAACGDEYAESSAVEEESSEVIAPPTVYTIIYNKKYADEANRLADEVKAVSSLDFECVKYEREMTIPENAVIIGFISDGVSGKLDDDMSLRDYRVTKVEGRIYISADSEEAADGAVSYVVENHLRERGLEFEDELDYYYDFPYPLENAFINGIPLESFDIVFASTDNEAKYKDVADDLKEYFIDNADIRLRVIGEGKQESSNELILGIVPGRAVISGEKESKYAYDEYKIIVSEDRVAVIGGNACAVWHGCMALADAIEKSDGKNLTDCVIQDTCTIIKVSCVGDSITEGVNSTDIYSQTYPVYLQRMLGFDYLVKNHGHSGFSVVFTDEYSYSKSYRFTQAKKFAPDVVIYMLGTNDCNPGQSYKSWTDGKREIKYREDTMKYIDTFRSINEDVQIFMCIPPTLCYSTVWPWEAWAAGIEAHTSVINREIAEREGLPIVDMFSWSKEHPEVFPDGLHPYNESYKVYASRVYDEIIDVIITTK